MDIHENMSPSWSESSSSEDSSDDNDSLSGQNQAATALPLVEQAGVVVDDGVIGQDQAAVSAVIHAREYQLEMLEESLKRNIIVTVGRHYRIGRVFRLIGFYRWKRVLGKHRCKSCDLLACRFLEPVAL